MSRETYNGNPLLKGQRVEIPWTEDIIKEYIKCANDPLYFASHYVNIVTEDGLEIFHPYKYQKEIISSVVKNRNTIITTCRQAGKTTSVVAALLWYVLFNEHKSVGVLANKAETARQILSRFKVAYQHLPKWLQQGIIKWNEGSIELENGCKIIADATTGNSVRGYTFQMIFIDEAAHIEGWDEFFTSVYPTISAGKRTKIVLVSTPNGLNYYWNLWMGANSKEKDKYNGYNPIFVTWKDVPGRDKKWYENTMKGMNNDQAKFDQEFNAEFLGSSGTLIAGWKLKEMFPATPIAEDHIGLKQYVAPIRNHVYYMVCDVSEGKQLDYSTFQLIDVSEMPYQQVATFRSNNLTPMEFAEIIHRNCVLYNEAFLLIENKSIGSEVCNLLYFDFEYENLLKTESMGRAGKRLSDGGTNHKTTERGIATSVQVKAIGCSVIKLLIEQNQLPIIDYETIQELSRFSKKGKSYEAESGCHDDLTMPLVLFAWATQSQFFKDTCNINTLKNLKDMNQKQFDDIMVNFFQTTGDIEDAPENEAVTTNNMWEWLLDDNNSLEQHFSRWVYDHNKGLKYNN